MKCNNECPCRAPDCEEGCPNFLFEEKFRIWLATAAPDLTIRDYNIIVGGACEILWDVHP
jgi:hypothetical protein